MTKKELIESIKDYPDDAIITISKYTGCMSPLWEINKSEFKQKGDIFDVEDDETEDYFNEEFIGEESNTFIKSIIHLS